MSQPVNQTGTPAVDGWLQRLAGWIGARRCLACQEPTAAARTLCTACNAELPWNRQACRRCALPLSGNDGVCDYCLRHPPPITRAHATFVYASPIDRLLPRLKFHHDLAAGRWLANGMSATCAALPRPEVLVPIPLHRARLRQRGYDQALELARPLARALAIGLRTDLLARTRSTSPQSRLDAHARARNLQGAFTTTTATLPGHVALIDDVMTTGATLHAAARALQVAGVARIDAWICARVP